ncbi:MAG: leucine--tRNA ligase [Candidatus Woykebacteria bacterium]
MDRYDPIVIEQKWRKRWEDEKTFKTDLKNAKKPFYNLMMFPYPSGEGLHVGHVYAFGGSDTFGRFKRLQGYDVFEPMGFDSFGIHSENYAIKTKTHPKDLIEKTTGYFREKQLKRLGALFDWDRQVITSDPDYYKWTQWIFIQLFKAGLAVRKKAPVNWCPSCKTVLADEQVISGRCERCNSEVVQKELAQWFFRITEYAEKLLNNLETIDWSQSTKLIQRNWIGRSEGAEIDFPIKGSRLKIRVFTTRPDTIYGATFMVLAPEHELALKISSAKFSEAVRDYIAQSKKATELERSQAKTGVFTGAYCLNPFTNKQVPIWVADYVLGIYGSGAIMAVPAHDQRDFEFAKRQGLKIVKIVSGGVAQEKAYVGEGKLVNSGQFNGLNSQEAIDTMSDYIEKNKFGRKTVNYHLRDWLISRQRYWGPPIPMIFCALCAKKGDGEKAKDRVVHPGWYAVPEKDLPVRLPHLENYQPKGRGVSPLATMPDFVSVKCPKCGKTARRETDVSDTFLDSSWYFLRYPSTEFKTKAFDQKITKKWLPVNSYIGGNEHAVMHLLYSRFITMALKSLRLIDFEEPFNKFRAHGLIIHKGAKMSKSRGNVVNPNDYMDAYGPDALRMYLLFIGPYDLGGDFSDRAIAGVYRFLNRVWKLLLGLGKGTQVSASDKLNRAINRLVLKAGEDLESLKFNTAIAAIMEFTNLASKHKNEFDRGTIEKYLIVLSPFAPFTTEELWERLGFLKEKGSVHHQAWPISESKYLEAENVTIAVQINGKLRDTMVVERSKIDRFATGDHFVDYKREIETLALSSKKVKKHVNGRKVRRVIYVPEKVLNIVVDV